MSPAPNDGMIPDYSGGQSFTPDYEPTLNGPSMEASSYDPADDSGGDIENLYQPMPANFIGGLDHVRAKRQRDIDKMLASAQKSPVWKNPDGTLTKERPDPYLSGQFIPMGGDPYRINNPNAAPVQYKMAQQMQKQFSFPTLPNGQMLSDATIYQQAPMIWQNLLKASDGNMNPQNFLSSPFWDQFKGLDNETLAALKTSVGKAIQPFYKPYVKSQQTMNQIKTALSDPDSGGLFAQFYQPFEKEVMSRAGSVEALNLINAIRSKADALKNDPDAMQAFQEMAQTSAKPISPDDNLTQEQINDIKKQQGYFRVLMETKSGSAFSNILNRYIQYKDTVKTKRNNLSELVSNKFSQASGGSQLEEAMANAVKSGLYDGKEWELKNDLKRLAEHDDQVKIGNQMVPGAKLLFDEKKAMNEIEQLRKDNYADSDIYITPDRRVIAGKHLEDFEAHDIKVRFPDSAVRGNGEYVSLPIDFFRDENEQEVFLTIPGQNETSPITYTYGHTQYVKRDVLEKLGVTKKDLLEDLKEGSKIIGRTKQQFIAKTANEYKPQLLNASQFLDKNTPDGQRFLKNKEFQAAMQLRAENASRLTDTSFIMTADPSEASYPAEIAKGLARGVGKYVASAAVSVPDVADMLGEIMLAGFHNIAGNEDEANLAFNKADAAYRSMKGAFGPDMDEAVDGGFLGLDKVSANPNATPGMHTAGVIAEIGGTMAGIGLEMAATGGAASTEAIAGKLTALGAKFTGAEMKLKQLSALSGSATEIARIQNNIAKFHMVTRESLGFIVQNMMMGKITPTELAEGGLEGAILGAGRIPGRGFFEGKGSIVKEMEGAAGVSYKTVPDVNKPSWFIDKWRLASATAAAYGVYGLDSLMKSQSGMTEQEQADWWKQPENRAGMALQLMLPYIGGYERFKGKDMARKTLGPIAPEPVSTDAIKTATTSELAARGAAISDQVEAMAAAKVEIPKPVLDEHAMISKALEVFKQELVLKDAQAKDLETWRIVNEHVMEQLKGKGRIPEKTMGLVKAEEIPLGVERKAEADQSLRSMPDDQFAAHHKDVSSQLDAFENSEIGFRDLPREQQMKMGEAQDAWQKADLEKYRRSWLNRDPGDTFQEMVELSDHPKDLEPGVKNYEKIKLLYEVIKNESPEALQSSYKELPSRLTGDINWQEVTKSKFEDLKSVLGKINKQTENQLPKEIQTQVDNTLKIRRSQKTVANAHERIELMDKAEKKKRSREIAGFGEVKLEQGPRGWIARAKLRNRAGVAEFEIPESSDLSRKEAEFLARDHFESENYLGSDTMQEKIKQGIYDQTESSSDISDLDREVANAVFTDATEGGKGLQAAAKKLTGEKYGFSKEDVTSMMEDFIREKGIKKAELRDFLKKESKEFGCD